MDVRWDIVPEDVSKPSSPSLLVPLKLEYLVNTIPVLFSKP